MTETYLTRPALEARPVIELEHDAAPFRPLGVTARRFNETQQLIRQFVILPDQAAYDLVTLWVMSTHVRGADLRYAFPYAMRLAFLSNGPASGKTAALGIAELLSARAIRCGYITAAGLLKVINEENLIPFLDEIDLLFGKTGASKRELRAILNAGYERAGKVIARNAVQLCFGPVAMAGIGANFANNPELEPLRTRTLAVWMRPKEAHEDVVAYRGRDHAGVFDQQRRDLADWGRVHMPQLVEARPTMPDGVENRDVDLWEPLLAIAELAGDDIAGRARAACRQYVTDESPAVRLTESDRLVLALVDIFREHGDPAALATETLTAGLLSRDQGYWDRKWAGNTRAAQMGIAGILDTMGVASVRFRIDGTQVRGYRLDHLTAYLPGDGRDDLSTV